MKRLTHILSLLLAICLCQPAVAMPVPVSGKDSTARARLSAGLTSPGTYLLGGLVFAGPTPINNPFNTGDIGYAMLFLLTDTALVPVDTVLVDTLGYYYFLDLQPGNYLVKAGLTPGSEDFGSFIPAYYGDQPSWHKADTLRVDDHIYNADIHLLPVPASDNGTGHIRGFVTRPEPSSLSQRVAQCEVILCNGTGIPVRFTFTDETGNFGFEQLPKGDYQVYADFTGKYSQRFSRRLNDNTPYFDSIEIQLMDVAQGFQRLAAGPGFTARVYPNPASGQISLNLSGETGSEITYTLISPAGQDVARGSERIEAGPVSCTIDIRTLAPGMYCLVARSTDGSESRTVKVLVR